MIAEPVRQSGRSLISSYLTLSQAKITYFFSVRLSFSHSNARLQTTDFFLFYLSTRGL